MGVVLLLLCCMLWIVRREGWLQCIRRHNEICDSLGELACLAYKDVIREPIVCDSDADGPCLIADLGV